MTAHSTFNLLYRLTKPSPLPLSICSSILLGTPSQLSVDCRSVHSFSRILWHSSSQTNIAKKQDTISKGSGASSLSLSFFFKMNGPQRTAVSRKELWQKWKGILPYKNIWRLQLWWQFYRYLPVRRRWQEETHTETWHVTRDRHLSNLILGRLWTAFARQLIVEILPQLKDKYQIYMYYRVSPCFAGNNQGQFTVLGSYIQANLSRSSFPPFFLNRHSWDSVAKVDHLVTFPCYFTL